MGELAVVALRLPIPGPVLGMALLFLGLLAKGSVPPRLATTSDVLLGNLSLLFVPAGVGVMLHAKLLGREWLPISIALIISTMITIAVTGFVMQWLAPAPPKSEKADD
jgi:putative effector of murein hydrolase LrgA (UPF0299 family)